MFVCDICFGTGHLWRYIECQDDPELMVETNIRCRECEGSGLIVGEPIEQDDLPRDGAA